MSNAFDLAVLAIFSDVNMTDPAIFKSGGRKIPIRAIKSTSRDDQDFGDSTIFGEKIIIEISKSEVQKPKIGDRIIIDEVTYEIYSKPRLDSLSLIWSCEVRS